MATRNIRSLRRARIAMLALWGALLIAPTALANQDSKPLTYMVDECQEVTRSKGDRVMVCTRESAAGRVSARVLVRWAIVRDPGDQTPWVVGWAK